MVCLEFQLHIWQVIAVSNLRYWNLVTEGNRLIKPKYIRLQSVKIGVTPTEAHLSMRTEDTRICIIVY